MCWTHELVPHVGRCETPVLFYNLYEILRLNKPDRLWMLCFRLAKRRYQLLFIVEGAFPSQELILQTPK